MNAVTQPQKTIEMRNSFGIINMFRELWDYRELLFFLAWRDYKARYRQTAIGITWAVIQPIIAMAVFVFVFARFKEISDVGMPYALYVYSGMILWQFFSVSIIDSGSSLVTSSSIITKIYFPRIIVPAAKVLIRCIDFLFSSAVLVAMMLYFGVLPSITGTFAVLPILAVLLLLTLGVGAILSALNVKYRDVQNILPYFVQIFFFFSPVFYSGTNFGSYQTLLTINPITGIMESFRSVLFSLPFPTSSFVVSIIIAVAICVIGLWYFIRSESSFSDIL